MKRFSCFSFALVTVLAAALAPFITHAADAPDPARDKEMRDRYETVLLRNPFQERAFGSVYEGYSKVEGVDKWIEALKPRAESGDDTLPALLLLGQIYDRQFKTADAISALEKAATKGESRPQFKVLLGTLYYKAGKDDKAVELLSASLDTLTDLDQRSGVCRMLGNLYLRQGKRDQAIVVWKRIVEQNPEEVFAQTELAEIYQENRMWDEAIGVYRRIADSAKDDPYRRCRALRSIGQCLVQAEKFKDAIATYEQALELVAPGNWLFEDLKLRLVGAYEDIGDLAGLVKYVNARLEQNAGDVEFRDLLAESYTRMARFAEAEKEYRTVLERNPRNSSSYEKLLGLYLRTGNKTNVVATFEKLIELFPSDTEYLRRLGEYHVRDGAPDKAKTAWRRVVKEPATGDKLALLASWFESYEFFEDAIASYQQAIEKSKNKDWVLRLAGLKHQKGDEAEAVNLWLSVIDPASSKAEDYAEIASILEASQKNDEAAKLRKAAVEKDPQNLEAHLAYAKSLMKQSKFEPAVAEFELLAAQDKNEFLQQQGESGRIDAWRELGLLEEKQKELERDLTANPTDGKKLGQLARLYERGGQREKAIALYEQRREKEPDNIEHLRTLVGLYKNAKQAEQAIAACKALLEKDKNRSRIYQKDLLDIHLSVDLKDEAIAAAEAIVSLAPTDPEARLTLAQVYQMYRQPEKALGEYRYALRLEPNEPDYWRQYGEALEQEKRYGEAQETFRKMLDVAKEDSTRLGAVSSLARIHLQQDRLTEIISEFQRRIRNTPKKLAAYEELATIYKDSGQIAKAVEVLEGALQNVDDKTAALKTLIRTSFEAQDFAKTRSYFEQLLSQSGKPTAQEYERLGQIYAQLGDIEKAKATWQKIIADAPKDAKAHDRLASILRDASFTDEALAVKGKSVELDPNDYKRRFEYAQLLSQNEQPVEALKQASLILELGDREAAKKPAESEKKVQAVAKGQQGGLVSPYQFVYGIQRYSSGRYYGGGWQGSYKQFRPQVLMFMAQVAQRSLGEDAFIEQITEKTKKAKGNVDAKRDLLTVLQMYNRYEDALKVAVEILEAAPNDVDLLQQTALYYQQQQQFDKAIALLEKLAQSQPKLKMQAFQGLVPLYFQNKQQDKAMELADQFLKDNPKDIQTVWAMGSFFQQNSKFDRARDLYRKALDLDPNYRANMMYQMAYLAQQEGKKEDAVKLYTDLLTDSEATRYAWMSPRRAQNLYVPDIGVNRPNYGGLMRNLPQQVFGYIDYQKGQAIQYLKQSGTEATNAAFAALETIARGYKSATTPTERNRSWDTTKLLCAYYLNAKENDKVADLLKALRDAGFDEMEWFNAAIYLGQVRDDYDRMLKLYDEVLQRFPAKAREVTQAKTVTLIMAKKYDEAAKQIREMNQQRVPPQQILALINQLSTAGEKQLAKSLLEEHLSGVSRNSETLAALARLYNEDNDYEKAIALANESWERKAHGRGQQGYYYGPGYYSSSSGSGTDAALNELHRYYVGAGKSDELISKFKERLEKQPGSVQAHESLAQLYRLSGKRDEAMAIYKQLVEKRPHLMTAKRQIASLYSEMGEMKKATEFYEAMLKGNPNAYQEISWELRYLYQRMGKGKELAQMEDKMAAKANQPYQIQNLASRYQQEGDYDKAIELYRKAIKMSPTDAYLKNNLASVLVQMGRLGEAVALYLEWLDSPQQRTQGNYIDHNTLKQLVGLFRATGKLQQLKDRAEAELKKNAADRTAKAMQVHIAVIEKRFDDAVAGFRALAEGGQDPNGLYEIMNLADITGNVQAALDIVEKADKQNIYDQQRLARLYMVKGDRKKAQQLVEEWYDRQTQYGNSGSYYLREVMRMFGEFELWEAAEKFALKHRSDNFDSSNEKQEFDRQVVDGYVKHKRFIAVVDDVMKKESFKGRDLDLVKEMARQLSGGGEGGERRAFLEKVVAADPKNRELAMQLAETYTEPGDLDKRIAILKRLVTEDANSTTYRNAYTRTLIDNGRADEALEELGKWVAAKPVEARYTELAAHQKHAGRYRETRASLEKAVQLADTSRKADARLALAQFDAEHGDMAAHTAAVQERFEKKKDAAAFQSYLSHLEQAGLPDEAYALFLANKDAGFLDRYQGDSMFKVCVERGDFKTPLEMNWQFTRYSETYYRDNYMERTTRLFDERGKASVFANDLQTRIAADTNQNVNMQVRLAKAWDNAGYPDKALALYDEMVKVSPFNRAAVSAKAALLEKLHRDDDAVKLLRDTRGITDLNDEVEAKMQLATLYFQLKRPVDGEKVLADLLSWAKGGNIYERVGNLYFQQKDYAKAAEAFEKSLKLARSWNYDSMLMQLGQCYAKLGRNDEAVKLWDDRPSSRGVGTGVSMMDWLLAERLYDATIRYIEMRLPKEKDEPRRHLGLAEARLGLGKTNEAFETLASAAREMPPGSRTTDLQKRTATFLLSKNLIAEALDRCATETNKLLATALVQVLATTTTNKAASELIATRVDSLVGADKEQYLQVGEALLRMKKPDAALPWFRKALASHREHVKVPAARGLAQCGGGAEAAPILLDFLKVKPHEVLKDPTLIIAVAKTGDAAAIEAVTKILADGAVHETERDYLLTLLTCHRGQTNEARARFTTLAGAPNLTAAQLKALAGFCADQKMPVERLKILHRLAAGGYGSVPRAEALGDLATLHARSGDLKQALAALAELQGSWGQALVEDAREAIADAVSASNYAQFKGAVLDLVQKAPEHDRVSNLLGLLQQIAQRLDRPDTAARLAEEARVTGLERDEAAAWDGLIENWEVAGPYRNERAAPANRSTTSRSGTRTVPTDEDESPEAVFPAEREALAKDPSAVGAAKVSWRKTDSKKTLGIIRLGRVFELGHNELANRVAYARTTIDSPEGRSTVLFLGSSDDVKVWVNGEEVHTSTDTRVCIPDQDRLVVPLKKGANTILLKVTNVNDDWSFCLRVTDDKGGPGLAGLK